MRAALLMAVTASLVVAGCNKGGGKTTTLATVGGEAITEEQLDTELRMGNVPNAQNPVVRKAALDQIIARKLLAQAAREAKLDQTPDAKVLKTAALEGYEANLQRTAVLAKVIRPTTAEAQAFVKAHPEMFAERTGYLVERLHVPAQADPTLVTELQPTKTLEEVEAVLQKRKINYRRTRDQIDTLRMAPAFTAQIKKLAPGEPFVTPEVGGFTVSRIIESRVQPVTGPDAERYAIEVVYGQKQGEAMNALIEDLKSKKLTLPEAKTEKK